MTFVRALSALGTVIALAALAGAVVGIVLRKLVPPKERIEDAGLG